MGFSELIRSLESYGVSDVLLPFILIFTIVFAVMQKTKMLGDGKKNYNVVVALVMALAVIIPHVLGKYPRNADIVDIMNTALPNVSIILVAILMVLIIMGIFGAKIELAGKTMGGWFAIIAIIIILIIFGNAAGWTFLQFDWIRRMDQDLKNLVIIILVFGVIIAFITNEGPTDKKRGFFENIGDKFQEIVSK